MENVFPESENIIRRILRTVKPDSCEGVEKCESRHSGVSEESLSSVAETLLCPEHAKG